MNESQQKAKLGAVEAVDAATVAAELEALGEAPLDAEESARLERGRDGAWEDQAEAFVALLDAFSAEPADDAKLDELTQRRLYARVQGDGAEKGGAGARLGWGVLLAAAAGLVLVAFRYSGEAAVEPGTATALRMQAHAGLEALGVEAGPGADAARVRALLVRKEGAT